MKIKRSIIAPTVVALIALATGGWLLQQNANGERNIYMQARLFEDVLHHVADHFVEPIPPADLYKMAVEGMLEGLQDPHTTFMTPKEYEDLAITTEGEYGGLGIRIDPRDNWVTIVTPLPGTPAEHAGLRAGDRIVEVNGERTKGWSSDEAVEKLRGPKGSEVNIMVSRPGVEGLLPFTVIRDEIHLTAVPAAYMLNDEIGYLHLTMFSETSAAELRAAVDSLRGQGMEGLVLDLRVNPGGLLDQGVEVADLFLPPGSEVVETRSRINAQNQTLFADEPARYADLPIIAVVGPASASASEIVAGALQDHDRALILGSATFGKGSVQTVFRLPGQNFLKLSTARWYTPSGRSIQKPYGIGMGEEEATDEEAPIFQTDAGREVRGGGGIHPDLVIRPDTMSSGEQAFYRAVREDLSAFSRAMFDFAVRYKDAHPQLDPEFTVSGTMLDTFYQNLRDAGIEVPRDIFDGARDWIADDLARDIAFATWGRQGMRRRANLDDRQVGVAIDLLQRATDAESLFTLAARYEERHAPVEVGAASGSPMDIESEQP